jgi:PAS domain S-box-containing protein
MDQRSFQQLLRRAVLIPVVLLVLLAVTLVLEIVLLTNSLQWVDHADQVIASTRQLMRFTVDMETGVRGYHLTNDLSFLNPYHNAKSQFLDRLQALQQLSGDNPQQQARLRALRELEVRWMKWADIQLTEHGGSSPSQVDLQSGKQLMEQIRAKQTEIVGAEEELRTSRVRRAGVLRRVVISSALGLSLAVAVVLFSVTRRELYALSTSYEHHLQAEEEKAQQLEEGREWFEMTLNSIADAVVSTDAGGKISFINPVAQQLTGWDHNDARGRRLNEVLHIAEERTRAEIKDPVRQVREAQRTVRFSEGVLLTSRSGRECVIELSAAPIRAERGELSGVVFVFRDISHRRQTEQTLRASERLTQAGRLAATIAHEIRNPLDTVSNLIYLLRHDNAAGAISAQYLELASDELARIAQITTQLLTFHRETKAPTEVELTDVLQSVLVLYAPQLRKSHIQVEQRYDTARPVRGFPGELRQVFSNLVGNAIEAMPAGGKLVLHTRESSLAADPERKGVRVTVLDTGAGIAPGVRKNLFAPFYTTKGEKGTGLGLWVSRGIVEKHEGTIHLSSLVRPGRSGTAFSVFLPFEQKLGMLDVPGVPPAA